MNFSGDKLYLSKRKQVFARTKDIHSFSTSRLKQLLIHKEAPIFDPLVMPSGVIYKNGLQLFS